MGAIWYTRLWKGERYPVRNMSMRPLSKQKTLSALPPPYPADLLPNIAADLHAMGRKLIVLDDDPTGTQTVYDVPVLTHWSTEALAQELNDPAPLVYILTNSRSLPRDAAIALNQEIAANLRVALARIPRPVELISRSDSTLRGHFPHEVQALCEGIGLRPDAVILAPAFFEGGRYTIGDTHYVADGDSLIPAAATEYAQDAYFGYQHSNLREWIVEKCGGEPGAGVRTFSIDDSRQRGPGWVAEQLQAAASGQYVIVNAADYCDLEVFVRGVTLAEQAGKTFIARTAASYVRVRAGLLARGLLSREELVDDSGGPGLVVVGSYIQKSTVQINAALELPSVIAVEIQVERLLDPVQRDAAIAHAIERAETNLRSGRDVLLFSSRALVSGTTQAESLNIGAQVSHALVAVVQQLHTRPAWLIAKGGITSSDIATKGLGIRRALVLGQLLPGVPVWRGGEESKWPGITYVVFPGNVGDDTAIVRAIRTLREG